MRSSWLALRHAFASIVMARHVWAAAALLALLATASAGFSAFCPRRLSAHWNAQNPVFESLGGGTFAAVWRDSAPESFAVAYARLDAEGAVLSGPVFVTDRFENILELGLATNGSRVAVTWIQRQGNNHGHYVRLLDLAGTPRSGPLRVDSATDPVGAAVPATAVVGNSFPLRGEVQWDGVGWGIAGTHFDGTAGRLEITYAHVASDGRSVSPALQADDSSATASEARLAWNGADHFTVTYERLVIVFAS